jgi:8-oxo-dGTP diphosphatase
VFRTSNYAGTAIETPEAAPLWTAIKAIPFERMWADDRIWLPLLIEGQAFTARWIFDKDSMLDHELDLLDAHGAEQVSA